MGVTDEQNKEEEEGEEEGDSEDEAQSEIVDASLLMREAAGISQLTATSARGRFDRWRGASVKWRVRLVLTITG